MVSLFELKKAGLFARLFYWLHDLFPYIFIPERANARVWDRTLHKVFKSGVQAHGFRHALG
jgi:hypothetical protein